MKDNVISMEEYRKRKDQEAYMSGRQAAIDAYTPPLLYRVQVKTPQPKPWYHWYKEQR
jgi:hypothetical protein